jgi:hypothetical protein
MTPATGYPGTLVTITGENFGDAQGSKLVGLNLGRANLMEVRSWSNTRIQAVVPNLPVGEYVVVVYYDHTYRRYAPWTGSSRFRIIPREVPGREPLPPTPDIRPPFPAPASCAPVAKATNLLCNPDLDIVGPLGAATSRAITTGGGAGDSAAKVWWLFVNGSGTIKTYLKPSDRSGATSSRGRTPTMLFVSTGSAASGVLQQFLARDAGPQRVTFAVWVKVIKGRVEVSLGNWGLERRGGWRVAATSRTTGQWELLTGCSVYRPNEPLPLNQIFIHAPDGGEAAEFYLDFAEVKNADLSWRGTGCIILSD